MAKITKKPKSNSLSKTSAVEVIQPRRKEEVVQQVIAEMHSGPLPRVQDFEAYNRVVPGAANRILKMAEKALDSEVFATKTEKRIEFWSMVSGNLFLYVLLGVSVWMIMVDKPIAAVLTGIAPIISVIYDTFRSKEPKKHKPEEKKKTVEKVRDGQKAIQETN